MHDMTALQQRLDPLFPGLMGVRLRTLADDRVVADMTVRADLCTNTKSTLRPQPCTERQKPG